MRPLHTTILAAVLVMVVCPVLRAQQASIDAWTKEFKGQAEASTRTAAQWEADYTAVVKAMVPGMGSPDANARRAPQQDFETMCFHASRPGAEQQRAALSRAAASFLAPDVPVPARVWVLRQLENMGRAEVVDALAGLLSDADVQIRTRAICALENNPAPAAAEKLRDALASESEPPWRVALINALAFRADEASGPMLTKAIEDGNVDVAIAAAAALGKLGTTDAAKVLVGARAKADVALHNAVLDACLVCADRLAGRGNRREAARICQSIFDSKEARHYRLAAMRGLVRVLPEEQAVAIIAQALESNDAELQGAAGQSAVEMPGQAAGQALGRKLPSLTPAAQVIVLRALGDRGDTSARPAVADAVKSKDGPVRLAAIEAMGKVGDGSSVGALAEAAAGSGGAERDAARSSLAILRGADVDSAVLAAIPKAEVKARCELVRVLPVRRAASAVPTLLALAVKDADESVRIEALIGLAALGGEAQLPALVAILAKPQSEGEAKAVEAAVTSVMSRMADADRRAEPVLAALEGASGSARIALVRALGRTGSAKALAVLRKAVADENPETQLAAVRGLADWPNAQVADDLAGLAKSAGRENVKVLALRGYVRVAALPSDRAAAATARMLAEAMRLARAEDKKLVLSALANVPAIEAMRVVEPCIEQAGLEAEAMAAAVSIGAAVASANGDEVAAVMQRVAKLSKDDNVSRQARELIRGVKGSEGFITDWMASGPYMQADKTEKDLFDIAFAPEKVDGAAKWKALKKGGGPEMDLSGTEMAGDMRCAYLRTSIWSPKAQEAVVEMGSDDGIKAWLNGKVVHANNVNRGSVIGQDTAKASLKEGWNVLLLKITNGGGGWSCNARVCGADGSKVEGMKVKAE